MVLASLNPTLYLFETSSVIFFFTPVSRDVPALVTKSGIPSMWLRCNSYVPQQPESRSVASTCNYTFDCQSERKRRPNIPMNHLTLLIILIFVLSILLPMLFRFFRASPRDKAKSVVEYAQRRGYVLVNPALANALDSSLLEMARNPAFKNSIRASSDIADIEELHDGTGDWLAFTCTLRSREATIFNLSVSPRRPDTGGRSIPYKVVKIKAPGLPRFSLGRNSVVHTVVNVVDKIVGAPKGTINVDARLFPEFSAHYWISGSDAVAVTSFLAPGKIRFLETARLEGILATNANYLVYFEDGVLVTEQDFDSFIARAETLVANLL